MWGEIVDEVAGNSKKKKKKKKKKNTLFSFQVVQSTVVETLRMERKNRGVRVS